MVNVTIYGIHGSYGIYYIYNMKVTGWLSPAPLQVMVSLGGSLLMPLSDGGIRHLLAGARASVGLKSGAFRFRGPGERRGPGFERRNAEEMAVPMP